MTPVPPQPVASSQARQLLASALRKNGPAWENAASTIECGGPGTIWTRAALVAIDDALRYGPEPE